MTVACITNLCTHYRYKLFRLLAEEHNWQFYFFDNPEKSKNDISHLKIYKTHNHFQYMNPFRIIKQLCTQKYDTIVKCTNNKWLFLATFLISKIKKSRFVVWHSIWHYPNTIQYKVFSRIFDRILKNHAHAIVVYGEHGKQFLMDKGIGSEKIFIGWQTVDNEIFGRSVSDDEINRIREQHDLPSEQKIVLYVGRLINEKGVDYLLKALSGLDKETLTFVVIGDGNLKRKMEVYCHNQDISARFLGIISFQDLVPFYKLASVLVLPSITGKGFKEPWGLVVNEAFNQGCPVVVTDAVGAGLGGLVNNGINGTVIPERAVESLEKAIKKIISDDQLRETLSRNALDDIEKWTYERQARGFLDAVHSGSSITETEQPSKNEMTTPGKL